MLSEQMDTDGNGQMGGACRSGEGDGVYNIHTCRDGEEGDWTTDSGTGTARYGEHRINRASYET